MKRKDVYDLINSERAYQNRERWAERQGIDNVHDRDKSVAEWIVYLRHLIGKAEKEIYELNKTGALDNVRKIAAVAVACMEHNETLPRVEDGMDNLI